MRTLMKRWLLLCSAAVLMCGVVQVAAVSAGTITLAFDYVVADEAVIDRFVLQRKLVDGVFADVSTTIPATREIADTTAEHGVVYCYRMFAEKGTTRSTPSNEVCGVFITAVFNVRFK